LQVIEEMCQLVKNNSIAGCKAASVSVVYTPWSNLRKESGMKEGQVGFHDSSYRKLRLTEKDKGAVKTLEATRREVPTDFAREKIAFNERCVAYKKNQTKERARLAQLFDPAAKARAEKLKHEEERKSFLAGGGYHGTATTSEAVKTTGNGGVNYHEWQKQNANKPSIFGSKQKKAAVEVVCEEESDEEPIPEGIDTEATWQEELRVREGETAAGGDLRWLRERGYGDLEAKAALEGLEGEDEPTRRRSALQSLLPRPETACDGAEDEDACEARGEEREALEAIYAEEYNALGGEDCSLPIQVCIRIDSPRSPMSIYGNNCLITSIRLPPAGIRID